MRLPLIAVTALLLLITAHAVRASDSPVRELRIDPATTGVPLGTAVLKVEPLVRDGAAASGALHATYRVDISPLSFAGEEGALTVKVSDEDLRRLAAGRGIEFTGRAQSTQGNVSRVRGSAVPAKGSTDHGTIKVQIESKKGTLVFDTTYHLVQ